MNIIVPRLRGFYELSSVILFQKIRTKFHLITQQSTVLQKAKFAFPSKEFFPLYICGFFSYKKMSSEEASAIQKKSNIPEEFLKQADDLFEEQKFEENIQLLETQDKSDVEIIWRLVRAKYNLATHSKTLSDKDKKAMILDAYFMIFNALSENKDHYAVHKWLAVVLNEKATFEGTKARIQQLENIKHHMNRAIELKPDDSTTLFMLGTWCFEITDMPWYQRKIANAIFDTLPTSSYEEALKYFLEAEKQHPLFYSQNVLMLGKTYMRLENYEQAAYYLELTKNYPVKQDKDQEAVKEATQLLAKAQSYLKK